MITEYLERLLVKCREATPGPWRAELHKDYDGTLVACEVVDSEGTDVMDTHLSWKKDDCRYIAAMSPEVGEALVKYAMASAPLANLQDIRDLESALGRAMEGK